MRRTSAVSLVDCSSTSSAVIIGAVSAPLASSSELGDVAPPPPSPDAPLATDDANSLSPRQPPDAPPSRARSSARCARARDVEPARGRSPRAARSQRGILHRAGSPDGAGVLGDWDAQLLRMPSSGATPTRRPPRSALDASRATAFAPARLMARTERRNPRRRTHPHRAETSDSS